MHTNNNDKNQSKVKQEKKNNQGQIHTGQKQHLPAPFNTLHIELQKKIKYNEPTEVQLRAIPEILKGNDVCAIAKTGQGKTAAYALPVLDNLLQKPQAFHTLVLAPARELAIQISQVFMDFAGHQGLRVSCLVGGMDMGKQQLSLAQKPHVLVGTPGRVLDHLKSTKGFNLGSLRYLVLDECDKLLAMDFEHDVDEIASRTGRGRKTLLFTATYSSRVEALQKRLGRASLVRLSGDDEAQVNAELEQLVAVCGPLDRFGALVQILEHYGTRTLVFCGQIAEVRRLAYALRHCGFSAAALHGDLSQQERVSALRAFAGGAIQVLAATDVAARGLDVQAVRLVINYQLPLSFEDYVHRVGRTARAGLKGVAVSIVAQSDVAHFQALEAKIGTRMQVFHYSKDALAAARPKLEAALAAADDVIRGRAKEEDLGKAGW